MLELQIKGLCESFDKLQKSADSNGGSAGEDLPADHPVLKALLDRVAYLDSVADSTYPVSECALQLRACVERNALRVQELSGRVSSLVMDKFFVPVLLPRLQDVKENVCAWATALLRRIIQKLESPPLLSTVLKWLLGVRAISEPSSSSSCSIFACVLAGSACG